MNSLKKWSAFVLIPAFLFAIFLHSQGILRIGFAVLEVEEGAAPAGTALFSFRDSGGVLVWEAGVGAVEPINSGRIFVDQQGTRTALAIANVSNSADPVLFSLRDASGNVVAEQTRSFAANEHLALYVDELFSVSAGFVGSLSFTSSTGEANLAAITLRDSVNLNGASVFATLPVMDLAQASGGSPGDDRIILPQVGGGSGFSTQIVLMSGSQQAISGEIRFFGSAGEPVTLERNGVGATQFPVQIDPNGVFRAEFTSSAAVASGYAVVTVDEGALPVGTALFRFQSGQQLISEAGVGAMPTTSRMRIFVDFANTRTGVAVANPQDEAANVTFQLRDRNGQVLETAVRVLTAGGHLALFADELFPSIPAGFSGQVDIDSDTELAAVTLKLTTNERGEPILTTLPVVDLNRPLTATRLVFPEIGFGLGFSTRLILLSGDDGSPGGGRLFFFQSDGSALPIPFGGATESDFSYDLSQVLSQQFFLGVTAPLAEIFIDESSLTLNVGGTAPLVPVTLDQDGNPRDDFVLSFQSLNPGVFTVDEFGNLTGESRGFGTLVISSEGVVETRAVTVATVSSGAAGFEPTGVATDQAGAIFLANSATHTILRAPSLEEFPGVFAGVAATPGFQNGAKLNALFDNPSFIAVNQSIGTLYVSDANNHVIRSVQAAADGEVVTLAGSGQPGSLDGPVLQARFNHPQGIALDETGHVWVADSANHTIRRISLQDGVVTTIAGLAGAAGLTDGAGSQARFNGPRGIAVEREALAQQLERELNGLPPPPVSVIVADTGNNSLRRVFEDGTVETLQATTPSSGLTDPLEADPSFPVIRPRPLFSEPTGVAVDTAGNIYVTEASAGRVRILLSNGQLTNAAQRGSFTNPQGLVITPRGRILVADGALSFREIRYAGPTITEIVPSQISADGGAMVLVRGQNLAPGSRISIGGIEIEGVVFEDTETLSFIAPPLPGGRQVLTVHHQGGLQQLVINVIPKPADQLVAGQITTIAGGGSSVGDGFTGAQAKLRSPTDVIVDSEGTALIADRGHHRVRQSNIITGVVSTFAGNGVSGFSGDGMQALAASLSNPESVAFGPGGFVYIADSTNHRIRRVGPSGQIETVAGIGTPGYSGDGGPATAAQLDTPTGVVVAEDGTFWIADRNNHVIRRVSGATGVITSIAGFGEPGSSGDGGAAGFAGLDSPYALALFEGSLIVSDTGNHRVRRIDLSTGTIMTLAGTGFAGFNGDGSAPGFAALNSPRGLAVDADGLVYVADSGNHRIRRFSSSVLVDGPSFIETVAGNGFPGFSGDGIEAVEASLLNPFGVGIDSGGNILIADTGNHRVRRVDGNTQTISTLVGSDLDLSGQGGLAVLAALADPTGVATNAAQELFVADGSGNRLWKLSGGSTTGATSFFQFSTTAGGAILDLVAGTGEPGFAGEGVPAAESPTDQPVSVLVQPNQELVFIERGNHRLRRIDSIGQVRTLAGSGVPGYNGEGTATSRRLNHPFGLGRDSLGNIYIADVENHRIRRVSTGGVIVTVAGTGQAGFSGDMGSPGSATFNGPHDVAIDGDGNVFIADTRNHRIRAIVPRASQDFASNFGGVIVVTVAGNGEAGFGPDGVDATESSLNRPSAIAVFQGHLYIVDSGNHRIRAVDISTGIIRTVAGIGSRGFSGDGGPAIEAELAGPLGITFDSSGNLIFADRGNKRVRLIRGPLTP